MSACLMRIKSLSLDHHVKFRINILTLSLIIQLPLNLVGFLFLHKSSSFLPLSFHVSYIVKQIPLFHRSGSPAPSPRDRWKLLLYIFVPSNILPWRRVILFILYLWRSFFLIDLRGLIIIDKLLLLKFFREHIGNMIDAIVLFQSLFPLGVRPKSRKATIFQVLHHILHRHHVYLVVFLDILVLSCLSEPL
jgi:hypothetical protein